MLCAIPAGVCSFVITYLPVRAFLSMRALSVRAFTRAPRRHANRRLSAPAPTDGIVVIRLSVSHPPDVLGVVQVGDELLHQRAVLRLVERAAGQHLARDGKRQFSRLSLQLRLRLLALVGCVFGGLRLDLRGFG